MDYLDEARLALEKTHNVCAKHLDTIGVKKIFNGTLAWAGDVEVFEVTGHPKAEHAYVWGYPNNKRSGEYDFVAILGIPPITSASIAVQAAIAAEARRKIFGS